jgi:hypothetical protein
MASSKRKNGVRVRSVATPSPAAIEQQAQAPKVNGHALLQLEGLADACRQGVLQGFVLLGVDREGNAISASGGAADVPTILLAFEVWRHQQLHHKAEQPLPGTE